ncbi:MAG: ATP-binding cassette domain-containing protein [Nitrospirota bacterium]
MSNITVDNLVKKFGGLTAVDGISFAVEPGEVFGFLGPNGAGKSTTISMLCTLLSPTSGRASVAGFDCVKEPDHVRRSIGIIFQDPTLDNGLTAYENLLFHAYLYGLDRKTAAKRIEESLELVGLSARRKEIVRRFSGGMKRRLEIARGLLNYPKVLFMDEPTLGLDPQTRNMIWEFIRDLKGRTGITIFMTTHYLEEAEFCDRIAIIDLGRIITIGTPAELKAGLKGDTLRLSARDNDALAREISEKFSLMPTKTDGGVILTVEKGEELLPSLIKGLESDITSVSLTRPSLNDVFLALTGKNIREEGTDAYGAMRSFARAGGRRH